MNVLSLFDGMSGGQQGFKTANIKINKYYASEIEEAPIKVTMKNHPNTVQLGDVRFLDTSKLDNIDILIGGSPCQSFSFAGKREGMATKDKIEIFTLEEYLEAKENNYEFEGFSYLFWEYIRILKEIKPKYFLLENVPMAKKWEDIISNTLGVKPLKFNSNVTSAQDRLRLYWTNIPDIQPPQDKNIYLNDILQNNIIHKYLPKTRQEYTNYDKTKVDKTIHKNTSIQLGSSKQFGCSVRSNGKAFTVRKTECNGIIDEDYNIRKFTPIEVERLFNFPDNYTLCDGVSTTKRYEMLGNGWDAGMIAHIFGFIK